MAERIEATQVRRNGMSNTEALPFCRAPIGCRSDTLLSRFLLSVRCCPPPSPVQARQDAAPERPRGRCVRQSSSVQDSEPGASTLSSDRCIRIQKVKKVKKMTDHPVLLPCPVLDFLCVDTHTGVDATMDHVLAPLI
eukprot:SAG22_NODE_2393_length_2622_cov_2.419738_1_plen_136_part_10